MMVSIAGAQEDLDDGGHAFRFITDSLMSASFAWVVWL